MLRIAMIKRFGARLYKLNSCIGETAKSTDIARARAVEEGDKKQRESEIVEARFHRTHFSSIIFPLCGRYIVCKNAHRRIVVSRDASTHRNVAPHAAAIQRRKRVAGIIGILSVSIGKIQNNVSVIVFAQFNGERSGLVTFIRRNTRTWARMLVERADAHSRCNVNRIGHRRA